MHFQAHDFTEYGYAHSGGMIKMKRLFGLIALCLSLIAMGAIPAIAEDVAGSKDHPVVTRYPDSVIKWYDVQAFEPYTIATGPVTSYRAIDDWIETQGRTTRIYYELEGTKTHMEVFANYKKALEYNGFTMLAQGVFLKSSRAPGVGSRNWLGVHYGKNEIAPDGIRLLQGSSTSAGSAFVAATKERQWATFMW